MNRSWSILGIILVVALLIICCITTFVIFGASSLLIRNTQPVTDNPIGLNETATSTPVVIRPTTQATPRAPTTINPTAAPTSPVEKTDHQEKNPALTLRTLSDTIAPINDPADIARRLQGKTDIPPTLEPPDYLPAIGDRELFWATNTDTNENFQVSATLSYITDHAYFWIEEGFVYKAKDLQDLVETFEQQIYPTNREFFGSEWSPGIDGDPHLYILYASGLGGNIAGYFSSNDSLNPLIQEYSNGHEMFVLNADQVSLREEFTYGVLAHEFQHMIHWYRDRNETSWLNEGFSDLAMFLNGYDIGGHDFIFAQNPDLQLNDWPNDPSQTTPHYGASFLFTTYFLDRFGYEATQALVSHSANGMDSIDNVLKDIGATDPLTGSNIDADDVFADWVLASYLQNGSIADGRYTYQNYTNAPQTVETETIHSCEADLLTRDVRQYGADHIRIKCNGDYTLHFEGSTQVGVLPADPYSGSYAYWSNKGDESDMTLTRTFDFSNYDGPLTLSYWTWFDIEEDWDYLYLEATLDGENWQILNTPSGTAKNPVGANYGWGYTGISGNGPNWIKEEIDISQFAGQEVQLRFEYVTDAAVNGEGLLLDDISIPEIGYFTDFEDDDGGWEADGFVRIQNILPQDFRVALISQGRTTTVEHIPLSADNASDIPLSFGNGINEVVLVVSGTTRFTRQPAAYRFHFSPSE